eukprot:3180058-Prymnesium_polylepis.1
MAAPTQAAMNQVSARSTRTGWLSWNSPNPVRHSSATRPHSSPLVRHSSPLVATRRHSSPFVYRRPHSPPLRHTMPPPHTHMHTLTTLP